MRRIVLGFGLAPWVPALLGMPVLAIYSGSLEAAVVAGLSVLVFAYGSLLVFGAPTLVIFRRMGWRSAFAMLGLGLFSALEAALILAVITHFSGQNEGSWMAEIGPVLLTTLPIGAISGLALWWIGVRNNPSF